MEFPGSNTSEQSGIASRRPGCSDAVVCSRFREVQNLSAVDEHGGAGFPQVEPAGIDLGKMSEQFGIELP